MTGIILEQAEVALEGNFPLLSPRHERVEARPGLHPMTRCRSRSSTTARSLSAPTSMPRMHSGRPFGPASW